MTPFDLAQARWPNVPLSPERFASAWIRLTDSTDAPLEQHAADVYLATACLDAMPEALAELRHLVTTQLPALTGLGLSAADANDVISDTLSALIDGKLRRYSGRGPLEAWLRIMLTNRALDRVRRETKAVEFDDVLLGDLSSANAPELELLRTQCYGNFSTAFRAAITRLTARQRNLLRQHHLDELTLEELGALYQVHRATAARWLAEARGQLLELTHEELSQRLGLRQNEVESLIRVIGSRLDLSASLFLSRAADSDSSKGT